MHDEPPVSPSDSEEISPAPKARLRWLWRTLLGVALALLLALGAVAGLLASARDSAGLTRLVQVIEWGSGGRLTVAAAEGDLFSRWQLHDIRFESATTQLGLSRLELAWQPSALWQQHAVRVDLLALGDLRVVSQRTHIFQALHQQCRLVAQAFAHVERRVGARHRQLLRDQLAHQPLFLFLA